MDEAREKWDDFAIISITKPEGFEEEEDEDEEDEE